MTHENPASADTTVRSRTRRTTPVPADQPMTSGAYPIRVRYCECDPMGVAHHSSYIPWFEHARTELLRTAGVSYAQLEEAGVFLAVVKLNVTYRSPARYDDLLDIRVELTRATKIKLVHTYEAVLLERPTLDEEGFNELRIRSGSCVLAQATTTLACIDKAGKPQLLPNWLGK